MPSTADEYLPALDQALAFVEGLRPGDASTEIQSLAASAVRRLPSMIRAVITLARTPGIDGAEVASIARPLFEAGLTAGWLGNDETRAQAWRAKGTAEARKALGRFANVVNGMAGAPVRGQTSLSLESRARQAGYRYLRDYELYYPALSAAGHGHEEVLQFEPGEVAVHNALEAAARGAHMVLRWAAAVLHLPGAAGPLNALARAVST